MKKKILSILTIAVFMLSLMPLTATTTAAVPTVQIGKIEPDLRTMIQEQSEIDPSGEMRVVIVLNEMAGKAETIAMLESLGATINAQHNIINAISASVPAQNIAELTTLSDVQKILVDEKKYVIPVPDSDDSNIAIENYIENYPYWYSQFPWWIEADKVWEEGITGEGVVAAVLDTGIFYEHPDLEGVVIDYKVFTPEEDVFPHDGYGHGTACSSVIAAQAIVDWDLGVPDMYFKVKGVAPGTKILGAKCFLDIGFGWDSWIIEGIEWAVESGADIISGSFGGLEIPNDGNDPTSLAMEAAVDRGVTCFIAAANSQGESTVTSPGCSPGVITVGASTENSFAYWLLGYWPTAYADGYENDQIIFWSSEGSTADGRTDPDVCAIGAWGLTLDTYPYYLWLQFGGTSMATPVAAGVGALVIEAYRATHGGMSPTPEQVKSILMGTAKDLGYPANKQGAGRVDAYQAYLAATSTRSYSDKPSIDTGVVHPGDSYCETIEFTNPIDSVATAKFETIDVLEIEGLSGVVGDDVFAYFTAPPETEYVEVRLKFDPEVCFGTPVQAYDGSQWTDAHINPTLYRIEDGDWIMLNYAYAHTNTQWFAARATPGDYALWFWVLGWGVPPETPITFDVQVTFMRQVSWDWVSTSTVGNELDVEISVPVVASPGPHSGFIKVISGGNPITIPVTVNVPAKLGQTFTTVVDVAYEPRDGIAGDWKFFTVDVDFPSWWCLGDITLTVSWTEPNTDFDVFLIAPDGEVEALSLAPSAPVELSGGGGVVYYTNTGGTMEVLSATFARGGCWIVGIHNTFLGNVFSETVTIQLMKGKPITSPWLVYMRKDRTKNFKVTNKIDGNLPVDTMVLSFKTETFYEETPSTVPGFPGFIEIPIVVMPDTIVLKVSIDWPGDELLELHLWDPAGALRGLATEKGEEIVVCDPTVGYWAVVITLKTFGAPPEDTDFTLCVGGIKFKAFADVTLDPASFTLDPLGQQTIEITAGPTAHGYGFIVFYDLDTGSIYSETLLIIGRLKHWFC